MCIRDSKNGELFGAGFWNEYSRTPLRMVHHGKDAFAERDLDAALERACLLYTSDVYKRQGTGRCSV